MNGWRTVRHGGLSLIELLVALFIGLILTAGIIQIFVGSNENYRFQEALGRVQETGRFALETIAGDLRGAGYRGCAGRGADDDKLQSLLDDGNADDAEYFDKAVFGFEGFPGSNDFKPSLDDRLKKSASPSPDPDGDVVRVRSVGQGLASIKDHDPDNDGRTLFVDDASPIEDGEILIATDCSTAVVFQSTGSSGKSSKGGKKMPVTYNSGDKFDPGNINASMTDEFSGGDVIGFNQRAYYIASCCDADSEPALYRLERDSNNADELVRGVERMAVRYGEDTDDDRATDGYRTADSVSNWDDVIAVRVSLLVRSREDNVVEDPPSITFPPGPEGSTISASDRRMRQVFTTTVSLRNRLP